jgi:cellulose synthase operon protein C
LVAARVAMVLKTSGLNPALAKAVELQKNAPNMPNGSALVGDVLMAARQYAQAADAYDKALKLAPSTPLALRLFRAQVAAGKSAPAAAGLKQWFAQHPNDLAAAEILGGYELAVHDFAAAKDDFQFVLKKAPENIIALNDLAWLSQKAGDLKGARALAERAYLLSPNMSQTADTLGWIMVQQGQAADAVSLLRTARAGEKSDSTVQYHLAVALSDSGHRAEAMTVLAPLIKQGATKFDDMPAAEKLYAELSKK